jgi:hypothetical protein
MPPELWGLVFAEMHDPMYVCKRWRSILAAEFFYPPAPRGGAEPPAASDVSPSRTKRTPALRNRVLIVCRLASNGWFRLMDDAIEMWLTSFDPFRRGFFPTRCELDATSRSIEAIVLMAECVASARGNAAAFLGWVRGRYTLSAAWWSAAWSKAIALAAESNRMADLMGVIDLHQPTGEPCVVLPPRRVSLHGGEGMLPRTARERPAPRCEK